MNRSRWIHGIAVAVVLLFLTGCGAALTGVVGGAVFATKGGGGGGGGAPNSAATIPTAAVSSNSGAGTVVLSLTLTDAEGDDVEVEVRYSTDPNDPGTAAFPKIATGTLADAIGAVVAATQVPSSAGGINYNFSWNTAQDLGAVKVDNVRLQVLVRKAGSSGTFSVANSTATFVIDNTKAPVIMSATLGALPSGATVYSDDQQGRGFIPVTVVIADAESAPCSLKAFFSLDNGVSFPSQNAAAGFFVDGSGTVQPPDSLPTSPGGTPYTFRFNGTASGIGTQGQQNIVLQFQAADSKSSAPRLATAPNGATNFGINNASFTAILNTPSGSQITDKVILPYRLIDNASQPLDVEVLIALPGVPVAAATPVPQPPHTGSGSLPSSPSGTTHFFVWNAFFDMVVQNGIPTSAGIAMQLFVTRPTTQVRRGPFTTSTFSVDHRLIQTVFNKSAGVVDDVPGNSQPLGSPGAMARFNQFLYFCDEKTQRVRSIDLITRKITTVVGGGASRLDGTLGTDYGLGFPAGVVVSPAQGGTLFITEQFQDPTSNNILSRCIRVDGSTPVVTTFPSAGGGGDRVMALDEATDTLFFEINSAGKRIAMLDALAPQGFTVIAGPVMGSTTPSDDGTPVPALQAQIGDSEHTGGAVDTSHFGKIFFVTDRQFGRVIAINYSTVGPGPTLFGRLVPPGMAVVVIPGLNRPKGITIADRTVPGVVDRYDLLVIEEQGQRVVRIKPDGSTSTLIGSSTGVFGFAGEGQDPLLALMVFPRWICSLGTFAPDIVAVADTNNGRVRSLLPPSPGLPNGSFVTIGGSQFVIGDGTIAATSQFRVPVAVAPIGTDLLIADPILSRIRRVTTPDFRVTTVAGNGNPGVSGDGGQALAAEMGLVNSVAADPTGAYYFSQLQSHVVRKVDTNGVVTRIAGTATPGAPPLADGTEPATTVPISNPSVVALQGTTLGVACLTSAVYVVNLGAAPISFGTVLTVQPGAIGRLAGGNATVTLPADGADANAVCVISAEGLSISPLNGDVYYADSKFNAVFRVNRSDGQIRRIAGTGVRGFAGDGGDPRLAQLGEPSGVHYEPNRNLLYIADSRNGRIRVVNLNVGGGNLNVHGVLIAPNTIDTIAGGSGPLPVVDNGPATQARVNTIQGVGTTLFLDQIGNLIYADGDTGTVRRVSQNGTIFTVAGLNLVDDGEPSGPGGRPAENATLTIPTAVTALPGGAYLVVDTGRIRYVDPSTTRVTRIGGVAQQAAFGDGASIVNASFEHLRTTNTFADVTSDTIGVRAIAVSGVGFVTSLLAVADTAHHTVRLANVGAVPWVGPSFTLAPGEIRLLCGTGAPASGGDGMAAGGTTGLSSPQGVAFTSSGLLLIADTDNNAIRAVNLNQTGTVAITNKTIGAGFIDSISVVSSGGPGVLLTRPRALAVNELHQIIVVQNGDATFGPNPPGILGIHYAPNPSAVKFIHGRNFSLVGQSERLDFGQGSLQTGGPTYDIPRGVAIDPVTRDVYYAVRESVGVGPVLTGHTINRIPIFVPQGAQSSVMKVAGINNSPGIDGEGGLALQANLNSPTALSIDEDGNLYVLDARNFKIRRLRKFP